MNQSVLSRRGLLKGVGSLGLAAASRNAFATSTSGQTVQPPVAPPSTAARAAVPFTLSDVDLLDSPFCQARLRSQRYLLSLDPDRLLHSFRINAGLAPKAKVYGGWESNAVWTEIHCQGHTLGHYLSGCSLMYGATRDVRFKQRADSIVAELNECQIASKTGLLTAFPEGNSLMEDVLSGKKYSGVPWYTVHKVYAGLRDASLYTKNPLALEVLIRYCDWAVTATAPLTEAQFQTMLDVEHGGMNEVLADVYEMTGDTRYLALAKRFCHRAILDPLAKSHDYLDGLHANTQIPKIIGFNRLYQQTGEANYLAAAAFFWKTVTKTRSFVNGNHGDGEHFFPIADFSEHVFSAKTSETCCDYNMLKLTRMLFELEPSAALADFYERALYNDILASQDPDTGMVTYFQGNRPGYMKLYCTPVDSFWCCTGSGMENHAKYNDSIYFKGTDSIYVNLFIPSVVRVREGASLTQTTQFPEEGRTKLRWKTDQPIEMTLKLRHPCWCRRVSVKINGKPFLESRRASSYINVKRVWHDGDEIELELPMELRAVPLPGDVGIVAFVFGPIVLAGALGSEGIPPGGDLNVNERLYGTVLNTPFAAPKLTGDPATLVALVKPAGAPLTFDIPASGSSVGVRLTPYFKIAHERYVTYWKLAPEPDRL
ncbi:MAG: beta-L-arabinofuranosidase domain-containing protein [Janthinobacterium lividum]